jgi:hypothetical protein
LPDVEFLMAARPVAGDRDAPRVACSGPEPAAPEPQMPVQHWRAIIQARIETEDYSFNELGREAGVFPSVVMRFVKGERDVQVATAQKPCAALDLVLVPREIIQDHGPD